MQEINLKTRANLLPYSLSLTTYGIGSIQPGDTFRVDYLPKQHFKNTYLQTMKVTHNINSDGWYTSLDTQYRILGADIKKSYYLDIDRDKVFLSPNILDNLNIKEGPGSGQAYYYADLTGGRKGTSDIDIISLLKPCMMFLKVKNSDTALKHIDLILSFQTTTFTEELTELVNGLPSQSNPNYKDFIMNRNFTVERSLFTENQINAYSNYRFKGQRIVKAVDDPIGYGVFFPVVSSLEENEKYLILIRGNASCIIREDQLSIFLNIFDNPPSEPIYTDSESIIKD